MFMRLSGLTEQTGEKRHEDNADEGDAAARHELLDTLRFCARVVVSVPFKKVDAAPNAQTCAEGDYEGLENIDCGIKEIHDIRNQKASAILRSVTCAIFSVLLSKILVLKMTFV